MIFYRILDDKLYHVDEVNKLGFEKSEGLRIPDEYLNKEEFVVFRTAWGTGDWGIVSAMTRLLKEKYSNCKVYIPSQKLIKKLFNVDTNVVNMIFDNNPYVDGYKDSIKGEVFHDHYRIYNPKKPITPLLEQMLDFWQFKPHEYEDSSPEIYFTDEEREIGDYIINKRAPEGFGTLLLSNRFNKDRDYNFMKKALDKNKMPYFYWVSNPSLLSMFDVKTVFDFRNVDIRVQMYIKPQSKVMVGNMSGADIMFPRYTKVYMAPREKGFGSNIVRGNLITKIEDI